MAGYGKVRPGRKKGALNRTTAVIKAALLRTFELLQTRHHVNDGKRLTEWARENPTEFYKLIGRMVPHEIVGRDGGPIEIDWKTVDLSSLTETELAQIRAGQATNELLERLRAATRASSSSGA